MNENSPPRNRVEELVSQDTAVSAFPFEEFRMSLEASIQRLEQRARVIRRASLWGLGIILVCILSIPLLEWSGLFSRYEWLRVIWAGCGVVAMFGTGLLASAYTYRYQPALTQAKVDLQSTMIAQLQQQVADLNRKLESQ